jgi:hypothetical protein
MFACSRINKRTLSVQDVRVVERYETLSVYVPLQETVHVQNQSFVVRYDTLRQLVQLTQVQRIPVRAETVKTYVSVPVVAPAPAPAVEPAARWAWWVVGGIVLFLIAYAALIRRVL